MHNPFKAKRPNPKRRDPRRVRGRVRLDREGMEALRREVFERSGGVCEERGMLGYRCTVRITWESMELSHLRHGPNKTDELSEVIASCKECHRARHNGGKPCNRKPGRPMTMAEGKAHWEGVVCAYCQAEKPVKTTFCTTCWCKLSPQSRHDLLKLTGKPYLQAVADAERELLEIDRKEKAS